MHVKFAKQFTHYLILFQELESNKKILVLKGVVLKNQKKPPRTATASPASMVPFRGASKLARTTCSTPCVLSCRKG